VGGGTAGRAADRLGGHRCSHPIGAVYVDAARIVCSTDVFPAFFEKVKRGPADDVSSQ
jgi:hypothetical protein